MQKLSLISIIILSAILIGVSSCTHERLFTQSRYDYLQKVPVCETQVSRHKMQDASIKTQDTSFLTQNLKYKSQNVKCENKVSEPEIQNPEPKTLKLKHKVRNPKLIFHLLNRTLVQSANHSMTQLHSYAKQKQQVEEKHKTRIGRIISKVRSLMDYPPEKMLLFALVILLGLLIIILIGWQIFEVLLILALILALLYIIRYFM